MNVVGPDLDFQKSVISKFICKAGGSALVKVCIYCTIRQVCNNTNEHNICGVLFKNGVYTVP